MLSWLLPPMALHTHRGGLCRGQREAGLRGGGGGGGGESGGGADVSPACLPTSVTEPLLLLGCCLRPKDRSERGRLLTPPVEMMAEGGGGGGGQRLKALSLLEAARCRYESLQISDDVFGESGQDSSGNPFYSTTAESRSASEEEDEEEEEEEEEGETPEGGRSHRGRTGGRQGSKASAAKEQEKEQQQVQGGLEASFLGPAEQQRREEEEGERGWSQSLRNTPTPSFKDSSGPTRKMPPTASAMDFFQLFVPDNVLKNMVIQTNMYAKKYQERFGSDEAWMDVTLIEIKAFLAYMISTSTHHCESVLGIWSSGFYSNKSIALIMTQARFEKILKYFHIVAFRSSQTTHGLYKIQPFLDSLQHSFDSAFKPSQTQAT